MINSTRPTISLDMKALSVGIDGMYNCLWKHYIIYDERRNQQPSAVDDWPCGADSCQDIELLNMKETHNTNLHTQ